MKSEGDVREVVEVIDLIELGFVLKVCVHSELKDVQYRMHMRSMGEVKSGPDMSPCGLDLDLRV
jgi:hypothetical protein